MGRTRERMHDSFWARKRDGKRLRVDIYVTQEELRTLSSIHPEWEEVSRRYVSDEGPVNEDRSGNLTLARDGSLLRRES
jgi:hypothetical protein